MKDEDVRESFETDLIALVGAYGPLDGGKVAQRVNLAMVELQNAMSEWMDWSKTREDQPCR